MTSVKSEEQQVREGDKKLVLKYWIDFHSYKLTSMLM
jgi:hypothetical protein